MWRCLKPQEKQFFPVLKSQKQTGMQPRVSTARLAVSLLRRGSVRVIYGVWRPLLGPKKGQVSEKPRWWCRCFFGAQSSAHLIKPEERRRFPRQRETREEAGRLVLAEDGASGDGVPHAQTATRREQSDCWQNDTAWRFQGPLAGCTTVILTQRRRVISQGNLSCQRGQGATASNKCRKQKTWTWCVTKKLSGSPLRLLLLLLLLPQDFYHGRCCIVGSQANTPKRVQNFSSSYKNVQSLVGSEVSGRRIWHHQPALKATVRC